MADLTLESFHIDKENFEIEYKKMIPNEWIDRIIEKTIEKTMIPYRNIEQNNKTYKLTIVFSDKKSANMFETKFHEKVISAINETIEENNGDIKQYHRILSFASNVQNNIFNLDY